MTGSLLLWLELSAIMRGVSPEISHAA